ncbi:hypothetical protein [Lysinibacillus sphaericus]|nr:hypothetical protein [Lysinibacillus sphaericus]
MNLVIEEWKDSNDLDSVWSYTPFEWVAFITALSGIGLSIVLVCFHAFKTIQNMVRRSKRKI